MASAHRQPQILGNAQPCHRSESRRLAAPRKRDDCPGTLHEGDAVRVFSRSCDKWVDGEVVKFLEDNFVRVEYEVDGYWFGKIMHAHSSHISIPFTEPSGETLCSRPILCEYRAALPCTLREYLLEKHVEGNHCQRPSAFDFICDGYVHVESGVVVHFRPIRMGGVHEGPYQVLFHYTQKGFFDMITKSKNQCGVERSMLKASQDLSRDCDFGAGVYATELGPDQFENGIKGILLNNYPRKGPWGFAGEPGEQHMHLASHCIPVIVPRSWTKSYPLTSKAPTMFGRVLERKMRQGYVFDPDHHNIVVIQAVDIGKWDGAIDEGLTMEKAMREKHMTINEARIRHFMARLVDMDAVEALGQMVCLSTNLDVAVRRHAVEALGQTGVNANIDARVRHHAVEILRQIGLSSNRNTAEVGDDAVEALGQVGLNAEIDAAVRHHAVRALGQLCSNRDVVNAVRRHSVQVLGQICMDAKINAAARDFAVEALCQTVSSANIFEIEKRIVYDLAVRYLRQIGSNLKGLNPQINAAIRHHEFMVRNLQQKMEKEPPASESDGPPPLVESSDSE